MLGKQMQADNNINSQQANLNQTPLQTPLDNGAEVGNIQNAPFEIEDNLQEPNFNPPIETPPIAPSDLVPSTPIGNQEQAELKARIVELTKENEGEGFVSLKIKRNKIQLAHNTRKLPPSYLLPRWINKLEKGGGVISTCTAEQAHEIGERYILECIQAYERNRHPFAPHFKAKNIAYSFVIKCTKDTTIERVQELMDYLNAKYGWFFYMGSIHNDEGHIELHSGHIVKNRHIHLEFIALDKGSGRVNLRDGMKLQSFKRSLYKEICGFLGLTLSPNLGKKTAKRHQEPRDYARKQASKCVVCKSKQEQIDILLKADSHNHTPQGVLETLKALIETKASTQTEAEAKRTWEAYEAIQQVLGVDGDIQPQESGSAEVIAYQQQCLNNQSFLIDNMLNENQQKNADNRWDKLLLDEKTEQNKRLQEHIKRLKERNKYYRGLIKQLNTSQANTPPAVKTPPLELKPLYPIPSAVWMNSLSQDLRAAARVAHSHTLAKALNSIARHTEPDKLAKLFKQSSTQKPTLDYDYDDDDYGIIDPPKKADKPKPLKTPHPPIVGVQTPTKPPQSQDNTQELHTMATALAKATPQEPSCGLDIYMDKSVAVCSKKWDELWRIYCADPKATETPTEHEVEQADPLPEPTESKAELTPMANAPTDNAQELHTMAGTLNKDLEPAKALPKPTEDIKPAKSVEPTTPPAPADNVGALQTTKPAQVQEPIRATETPTEGKAEQADPLPNPCVLAYVFVEVTDEMSDDFYDLIREFIGIYCSCLRGYLKTPYLDAQTAEFIKDKIRIFEADMLYIKKNGCVSKSAIERFKRRTKNIVARCKEYNPEMTFDISLRAMLKIEIAFSLYSHELGFFSPGAFAEHMVQFLPFYDPHGGIIPFEKLHLWSVFENLHLRDIFTATSYGTRFKDFEISDGLSRLLREASKWIYSYHDTPPTPPKALKHSQHKGKNKGKGKRKKK